MLTLLFQLTNSIQYPAFSSLTRGWSWSNRNHLTYILQKKTKKLLVAFGTHFPVLVVSADLRKVLQTWVQKPESKIRVGKWSIAPLRRCAELKQFFKNVLQFLMNKSTVRNESTAPTQNVIIRSVRSRSNPEECKILDGKYPAITLMLHFQHHSI